MSHVVFWEVMSAREENPKYDKDHWGTRDGTESNWLTLEGAINYSFTLYFPRGYTVIVANSCLSILSKKHFRECMLCEVQSPQLLPGCLN